VIPLRVSSLIAGITLVKLVSNRSGYMIRLFFTLSSTIVQKMGTSFRSEL